MNKKVLFIAILALSGCATKQYPVAAPVSLEEANTLDCNGIEGDIARVKSIQQEIEVTGQFDGRTVLGVLGDLGVGNGMAKPEARKKAQARLTQLENIKAIKCTSKSG